MVGLILLLFFLIQEWIYYLNAGSQINISYSVDIMGPSLFVIIAEGKVFM